MAEDQTSIILGMINANVQGLRDDMAKFRENVRTDVNDLYAKVHARDDKISRMEARWGIFIVLTTAIVAGVSQAVAGWFQR